MPVVISGDSGITTPDLTDTSLTSGRVVYAGTSGNLTGSTNLTFDGAQLYVNGGASGIPLQLNNNTGSNTNVLFNENNTAKWYVRNVASDGGFSFLNATTSNEVMLLTGTGVKTFSTVSVGNATPSASGAGITFPATQSASSDANTLDDYEEGTFTPSIGGTATYNSQIGRYTKIGRLVTVTCRIYINALGTGSTTTMSGLPFTVGASGLNNAGSVGFFINLATSTIYLVANAVNSATTVAFGGLATSQINTANNIAVFANSTCIDFTITYEVA
jgi:hypothetical protein